MGKNLIFFFLIVFLSYPIFSEEIPSFVIEEVKIEGCEFIDENEVKLNLISKSGELFNEDTLKGDLKRIYELGYFKDVNYRIEKGKEENKIILVITVREKWSKNITNVDVEGNKKISKEVILSILLLKPGDELSKEKLEKDLQAIYALGFFSNVSPDFKEEENGTKLIFKVTENPIMEEFKFQGNTIFKEETLKPLLKTSSNNILNFNLLSEDRARIENYYVKKGYILARIYDDEVEQITNNGKILTFTLSEGKVEEIRIEGEKEEETPLPSGEKEKSIVPCKLKTKEYVIRRELKTKPGELLDINKLKKDLQRVLNLGYFEDVYWRPEPGTKQDGIIVVIKIREAPPKGLAVFSGGVDSRGRGMAAIDVSKDNLFGKGRRAAIRGQFGDITSYELSYYEPWADKKNTSVGLNLYDTIIKREQRVQDGIATYDEKKKGINIELSRPLKENVRLYVGTTFETVDITSTSLVKPDYIYLINKGTTRSLSLTYLKDTRDYIFRASSGVRDSLYLETCGGILGGDFKYNKTELDLRRYLRILTIGKGKVVYAIRFRWGIYRGDQLIYKIFTIGGADTLRGYNEGIFKGIDLALLNNEFRFYSSKTLTLLVFTDVGNVWNKYVRIQDFKAGSGFGIRYEVPMLGPIGLDYAHNWETNLEQLYFSFGPMY